MTDLRALFRPGGRGAELEITRAFRRPIDKVWNALSTPQRLADWMGVEWLGGDAPLREGAAFDYRFTDTDLESHGKVLRFDPPFVLEHSWFENIPPGDTIRWTLASEGDGCRLTLTHSFGAPDDAPRTAAGWTQLIGRLAAQLGEAGPSIAGDIEAWRRQRDAYAMDFGPGATRDGRRIEIDGAPALRFGRRLAWPIDRVWPAVAEPESMGRWMLAEGVVIEPRVGGRFRLGFDGGRQVMEGVVTAYAPPRVLEYTWTERAANGDSVVRIELSPDGAGCRLVLTHTLKGGGALAPFASGWHWHLDALELKLRGETVVLEKARLAALEHAYAITL